MALIKGKQVATGADGINTANIVDGALSADAAGRGKIAASFFNNTTTVAAKFDSASIGLDRLEEAVIQADGGQAFTANQPLGGFLLTGVGDGVSAGDAVNKGQLDGIAAGLSWKDAVKLGTTTVLPTTVVYANGASGVGATITAGAVGALGSIDGIATLALDRILVQDQAAGLQNGIYDITTLGDGLTKFVLTRVTDNDEDAEMSSAAVFVQQGTVNADNGFTQTSDSVTMGTTALSWTQFTGTAGITFGTPGTIVPDAAAAEGVSSDASRADHTHAIVADAPDAAAQLAAAVAEGNSTSFSRADHVHQANTAAGAAGVGDAATIGTSQDIARADHQHSFTAGTPVGLGSANAAGASGDFADGSHVHARDTANQEQVTAEAITGADTAITDTLAATPLSNADFKLFLNGVLQQEGAGNDYTRSTVTITWLASSGSAVDLEVSDELIAHYSS